MWAFCKVTIQLACWFLTRRFFKFQPMRTHYGPWQPCWISNQHQKHKSGRGPSNEHFWQVWLKSVQRFQSTWVHPDFLWGSCYLIFSFMCMFCRSLFVLLYFFIWPSCCLFFDLQILVTSLLKSVQRFQRRRFKCEKLTDGRRTLTHDKSSLGLWPSELKKVLFTYKITSNVVCPFVLFHLAIVLSVLRFTDSGYLFIWYLQILFWDYSLLWLLL
jgi:hypothetical protein